MAAVPRLRKLRKICVNIMVVATCLGAFSALLLEPAKAQSAGGGQFSVSQNGTARYNYPIGVPPGIAGMSPELALSYDSGSGNGHIGMGWSLSGLSIVGRCATSMATDGKRGSVQYKSSDKFCLDGMRLMLTDADGNVLADQDTGYGADNAEYRTEIDSYARIRSYGAAGGNAANGPNAWRARPRVRGSWRARSDR